MAVIPAAFPFVEVRVDTSALVPVAQRAPGVIAVVGKTPAGADGGVVGANLPTVISTSDDAATFFAKKNADGTVAATTLFTSLVLAMAQDPAPSKIYGVRVDADNYAAALASLEAVDDVTFVSLADEPTVGVAAVDAAPATGLMALKDHVERMTAEGHDRIGVAMVDPGIARSATYAADVAAATATLKSSKGLMVLVAARGSTVDAATAAMATIAGFPPQTSMVLKPVRGVTMPLASQYTPSETRALSEAKINPLIVSTLIVGELLRFADGRTYTSDDSLAFIDLVRVIQDITSRLKAGLVGVVGDARITKQGLTRVKTRLDGILGPLRQSQEIADYDVDIPVLNLLNVPESTLTAGERQTIVNARANRVVDIDVTFEYGPAASRYVIRLVPTF